MSHYTGSSAGFSVLLDELYAKLHPDLRVHDIENLVVKHGLADRDDAVLQDWVRRKRVDERVIAMRRFT